MSGSVLVGPEWVKENLKGLKVIDATWTMGRSLNHSTFPAFVPKIAGAKFFDVDEVCPAGCHPITNPHMFPSAEQFATELTKLGIQNTDNILIYDDSGKMIASARVWFTFKIFGHDNVHVLEGGSANWPEGVTIPQEDTKSSTPYAVPSLKSELVWSSEKVLQAVKSKNSDFHLIDVRPPGRFLGKDNEPRPGISSGSIPGSKNLCFDGLFKKNENDKFVYKSKDEILKMLNDIGISNDVLTSDKSVFVTMCGSGVTGTILNLALVLIGRSDVALFDGSWTEWSQKNEEYPKEHVRAVSYTHLTLPTTPYV
eukprot:TRINITY_DN878_c0_g1_i1.p1 TRINITY_DN878_c0_g1~~TRINITY_DN878_c0_g1_i1.p1  ORF type:complete len:325 (+),score=62.59 TRINITY_DN878_c0_g1_i1:43-975(+)